MKIKRMSAKILGLILAIALFTAAGAASVYAFFTSDFFKKLTGKIDENGNGIAVAEISSFDDLWKESNAGGVTEMNLHQAVTSDRDKRRGGGYGKIQRFFGQDGKQRAADSAFFGRRYACIRSYDYGGLPYRFKRKNALSQRA